MKQIKLLGISIFKDISTPIRSRFSILGLKFYLPPNLEIFLCLKRLKKNGLLDGISNIIFLFNHTGESSFIISSVNQQTDKRIKQTLFVGTRGFHKELVDIYCPKAKFTSDPKILYSHLIWKGRKSFCFDGIQVTYPAPLSYFTAFERTIREKPEQAKHFYENFISSQLPDGLRGHYGTYYTRKEAQLRVNHKLLAANVHREFILLSPESTSNFPLSDTFWEILSDKIRERGYDVVFNATRLTPSVAYGHSFYTTIEEGIILAERAKAVVGVRSGFLDLAWPASQAMHVIYTPFIHRSNKLPFLEANKIQKFFSLKHVPGHHHRLTEHIVEHTDSQDYEELAEQLIQSIKNTKPLINHHHQGIHSQTLQ